MKKGCCKHYTGTFFNRRCKAGVDYMDLVGGPKRGWTARLPCVPLSSHITEDRRVPCEKFEGPTDAEVAEYERQVKEDILNTCFAIVAIQDHVKQTMRAQDSIRCPACKTDGALSYSRTSSNGHISARCSTEGCVAFME